MGRNQSLKIFPENYVVLDIETTGLSPVQDEIIELSAIKVENNRVKEEFSTLVKPSGYLSTYISNLTGITQDMLTDAPNIAEALTAFMKFVSNSIVMGHNISFDISFIDRKLQDYHRISFDNDYIDTLVLAKKFLPQLKSRKLGLIAKHFNFDTQGMHRGLKDCVVTNMCYQRFVEMQFVKQQSLL